MEKIPNWIRWIIFFPISLISLFLVYPVIQILSFIGSIGDYDFLSEIWAVLTGAGFSGFCFVYFGALTAPKFHMIVAIILTAIYGILSGFMLTNKIYLGEATSSSWFEVIATVVVGLIGSIAACYQVYEKKGFEIENKPPSNYSF